VISPSQYCRNLRYSISQSCVLRCAWTCHRNIGVYKSDRVSGMKMGKTVSYSAPPTPGHPALPRSTTASPLLTPQATFSARPQCDKRQASIILARLSSSYQAHQKDKQTFVPPRSDMGDYFSRDPNGEGYIGSKETKRDFSMGELYV
jgi:hypothetical protein